MQAGDELGRQVEIEPLDVECQRMDMERFVRGGQVIEAAGGGQPERALLGSNPARQGLDPMQEALQAQEDQGRRPQVQGQAEMRAVAVAENEMAAVASVGTPSGSRFGRC